MQDAGRGAAIDPEMWQSALAGRRSHGGRLRSDSRCVVPGDVFVALGRDEQVRDHIAQALARGAASVLVDAAVASSDERVHGVPGLAAHIGAIADAYTGHPSSHMRLVGVTGTNGKTSTVQLLTQSWHGIGMRAASIGTLGAGMYGSLAATSLTTPTLVDMHELLADVRGQGAEAVAIELSSHALMQGRVDACRFEVAAFTNLTRDHLDYHESMTAYGEAKQRIFTLPGLAAGVLNLDDEYIAGIALPGGLRRVGVSSTGAPGAEVRASGIRMRADGADFVLDVDGERLDVRSPLIGRFNVDNLAMSAAIMHAQGLGLESIATAIGSLDRVPGRMQVVSTDPDGPLVVVDYAHTPDALRQALDALSAREGRLILVFGCTGDRDRGKRPDMARIAESGADDVVLTDDDVHHEDGDAIIAEVLAGFAVPGAVRVIRDREAAIRAAVSGARPGDAVLIAGKGHESVQIIGDAAIASDDAAIAVAALDPRSRDRSDAGR